MQRADVFAPHVDVRRTMKRLVREGVPRDRVERALVQRDPTRELMVLCMVNGVDSVRREDAGRRKDH